MQINLNYIPYNTKLVFERLALLAFINKYTLVGGTALSLQICHRKSEDLDFIFDNQTLNNVTLKRNIAKHFPKYKIIREEKDYQIDFLIENVKVTFFAAGAVLIPFSVKNESFKIKHINIANIETIAVLKMGIIAQRNTIRDYYDLYFLSKYEIGLPRIYALCKEKLPHLSAITYTETIIYTNDLELNTMEQHLEPKECLTKTQISEYFIEELKKVFA